jgi:gliding motility-associated-like protein
MKTKRLNIILLLLIIGSYSAHPQNCDQYSPVLTLVSVQPETGRTEFTWSPSALPDLAAYIIYTYDGMDSHAIDTVWDPAATSHLISNTAPKYSSISYDISAHRLAVPRCTTPLSNVLSTIFCEADADTCNKKINIKWNSYSSEPKIVTGYTVMISFNGSAFSEEFSTGPDITDYTINNFATDAIYCFYIRANLEGASFSTSNKTCVLTRMQRPPEWINADYATVDSESSIALSFSIDPESEIKHFLLERGTSQAGIFEPLVQLESGNGSVLFTDSQADANVINYYRLSAINSCKNPITVSNIASNIVLAMSGNGNGFYLSWNPYKEWAGLVSEYRLFIDTGTGFEEKTNIATGDTSYSLDYRDIMYDITGDEICMYVTASEISNPHGISGHSMSSTVCSKPIEVITVPNIFTPNNDLVNDLFRPVLSFTPTSYHLIVSEKHGSVLFETRDYNESWDGSENGNHQQEGIFLWFLKVTTPSGKNLTRTGTVTLLNNP